MVKSFFQKHKNSIMKTLFILLLTLTSYFGNESTSILGPEDCPPPDVENIIFDWDEDCSGVDYAVIVCNNNICESSPGILNLAFWPAPKDDMFIQHNFGQIPPQSCITITGRIRSSNFVNVIANVDGAPEANAFEMLSECE